MNKKKLMFSFCHSCLIGKRQKSKQKKITFHKLMVWKLKVKLISMIEWPSNKKTLSETNCAYIIGTYSSKCN